MSDSFTTRTEKSYFGRLGQSFGGMIGGVVLIAAACALLWWNESRAVDADRALAAAAAAVLTLGSATPDPANDQQLVHLSGPASATAALEDDLGARFVAVLVVRRRAEMYQWREDSETQTEDHVGGGQTETTTYSYVKAWSDRAIDSTGFKTPGGHENPAMTLSGAVLTATDGRLGGFVLDGATLALVEGGAPARPESGPDGWTRTGEGYFAGRGTPGQPQVGDRRIGYQAISAPQTLSILARQSRGGFAPWAAPNGYRLHLARLGDASAAMMIADQQAAEDSLTWILRGAGTVMNILGFALVLGPLRALANLLPVLATLVGAGVGLVALVLGLPLSLAVIGLAWLSYRPLLGGALLLVAGGLVFGIARLRKPRAAPLPAP